MFSSFSHRRKLYLLWAGVSTAWAALLTWVWATTIQAPLLETELYLLLAAYLISLTAPIAIEVSRRGSLDVFHPFILLFVPASFTVVRAMQIPESGWATFYHLSGREVVGPLLTEVLVLTIAAQIAYAAGFFSPAGNLLARSFPAVNAPIHDRRVLAFSLLVFILGLIAFGLLLVRLGDLGSYLNALGRRRDVLAGTWTLQALVRWTGVAALLIAVVGDVQKNQRWARLGRGLFVMSIVLVTLLGSRSAVVQLLLVWMMVRHYAVVKIRARSMLLTGVIVVYAMVWFDEFRRRTALNREFDTPILVWNDPFTTAIEFLGNRGTIDRTIVFLAGVPEQISFQFFATYSRLATVLVPRALWAEKPGLTEANVYATLFDAFRQANFATLPAGTVADYYLQAGWLSVVLLSLLNGVVARSSYEWMLRHRNSIATVVVYSAVILSVGGGITNLNVMNLAFSAAPVLLIAWAGKLLPTSHPEFPRRVWRTARDFPPDPRRLPAVMRAALPPAPPTE